MTLDVKVSNSINKAELREKIDDFVINLGQKLNKFNYEVQPLIKTKRKSFNSLRYARSVSTATMRNTGQQRGLEDRGLQHTNSLRYATEIDQAEHRSNTSAQRVRVSRPCSAISGPKQSFQRMRSQKAVTAQNSRKTTPKNLDRKLQKDRSFMSKPQSPSN